MKNTDCDKLILAVLQGEEYQDAIAELNQNGFYATVLQSRGGFLHCRSATILVGVHHTDLPQALALLKRYGERTVMQYQPLILSGTVQPLAATAPLPVQCGGVTLFVLDVQQFEKY